jgi:hypothetical protein
MTGIEYLCTLHTKQLLNLKAVLRDWTGSVFCYNPDRLILTKIRGLNPPPLGGLFLGRGLNPRPENFAVNCQLSTV